MLNGKDPVKGNRNADPTYRTSRKETQQGAEEKLLEHEQELMAKFENSNVGSYAGFQNRQKAQDELTALYKNNPSQFQKALGIRPIYREGLVHFEIPLSSGHGNAPLNLGAPYSSQQVIPPQQDIPNDYPDKTDDKAPTSSINNAYEYHSSGMLFPREGHDDYVGSVWESMNALRRQGTQDGLTTSGETIRSYSELEKLARPGTAEFTHLTRNEDEVLNGAQFRQGNFRLDLDRDGVPRVTRDGLTNNTSWAQGRPMQIGEVIKLDFGESVTWDGHGLTINTPNYTAKFTYINDGKIKSHFAVDISFSELGQIAANNAKNHAKDTFIPNSDNDAPDKTKDQAPSRSTVTTASQSSTNKPVSNFSSKYDGTLSQDEIVAAPYYRSAPHDNGPNDSPDKPDTPTEIQYSGRHGNGKDHVKGNRNTGPIYQKSRKEAQQVAEEKLLKHEQELMVQFESSNVGSYAGFQNRKKAQDELTALYKKNPAQFQKALGLRPVYREGLLHFEASYSPTYQPQDGPFNLGASQQGQRGQIIPQQQDIKKTSQNEIVAAPYYRSAPHDNGPNNSPDKPDTPEEIESRELADVIIRQNPNIYGAFIDSNLPTIKRLLGNYNNVNSVDSREVVQTWWETKSRELERAGFNLQDGSF